VTVLSFGQSCEVVGQYCVTFSSASLTALGLGFGFARKSAML
jgi:hypothetical protein